MLSNLKLPCSLNGSILCKAHFVMVSPQYTPSPGLSTDGTCTRNKMSLCFTCSTYQKAFPTKHRSDLRPTVMSLEALRLLQEGGSAGAQFALSTSELDTPPFLKWAWLAHLYSHFKPHVLFVSSGSYRHPIMHHSSDGASFRDVF